LKKDSTPRRVNISLHSPSSKILSRKNSDVTNNVNRAYPRSGRESSRIPPCEATRFVIVRQHHHHAGWVMSEESASVRPRCCMGVCTAANGRLHNVQGETSPPSTRQSRSSPLPLLTIIDGMRRWSISIAVNSISASPEGGSGTD